MKKILITLLLAAMAATLHAYDWTSRSNEQLRGEMLDYCTVFSNETKGKAISRKVKRFARKQARIAQQQPYAWIDATIQFVTALEKQYPPVDNGSSHEATVRRHMFRLLDFPLHVDNKRHDCPAAEKQAFADATAKYLKDAAGKALAFIEAPAPTPGVLALCKVYNMGYILRTSERTILLDVKWTGTEEEAARIASKADVFFLTHPHGDHYNPVMLKAMADAGKTIVLPCPGMKDFQCKNYVLIDNDLTSPMDIEGISVLSIFGNQGVKIPNNVYHLTFDGWTVIDQGDNKVWDKQEALASYPASDIIISPVWNGMKMLFSPAMKACKDGRMPVYLTSHENELGHTVDHRESYWELFTRQDRLADPTYTYPPVRLLGIGECQYFKKSAKAENN